MSFLVNRVPSHIGYVVDDLEKAAHDWATRLGAGPFYVVERVKFDAISHYEAPCIFDHSPAFGQWGHKVIELQQVYEISPPTLKEKLIPGVTPIVNHISYLTTTPEEDSADLSAAGYELFLHAKLGPVEVRFHDTRGILGQSIEIHRQCEYLQGFFEMLAGEASRWDGKNPLRIAGKLN